LEISVHYLSESNGHEMRITTARFCRKCGAAIPPDSPQQSCGACLLETGLGPDEAEREEVAHTVATPAEIEEELRHLIAALRS
jgi:hypothetical protein